MKHSAVDVSTEKKPYIWIIPAICILMVISLIIAFVSCKDSGSDSEADAYVKEYQKETTIISRYYEQDDVGIILPTAADRHDIDVIEGGGADAADVYGFWKAGDDEILTYIFDGKSRGIMLTSVDNCTFVYSAEGGELRIDMDNSEGNDVIFQYTVSGDTLTLVRGDSTIKLKKIEQ